MDDTSEKTPTQNYSSLETVDLDDILTGSAYRKRKLTRVAVIFGSIAALLIASLLTYYIGIKGNRISLQWISQMNQPSFVTVPVSVQSNIIPYKLNINSQQSYTINTTNAILYLSLTNQNTIQFNAAGLFIKNCNFTYSNNAIRVQSGDFCSASSLQGTTSKAKIGLNFPFGMNDLTQLNTSLSLNTSLFSQLPTYTVFVPAGAKYLSADSVGQTQQYKIAQTAINGYYFFLPNGTVTPTINSTIESEIGNKLAIYMDISVDEYWDFMGETAPIELQQKPNSSSYITMKFELDYQSNPISSVLSQVNTGAAPECLAASGGLNYYIGNLGYHISIQSYQGSGECILTATPPTNTGAIATYYFQNGIFFNANSAAQVLTPHFPFVSNT